MRLIELPSIDEAEGCIQCQMGSKLVLFVTGHCHWMCDYCPLSENRREIDFMYANERRVDIGDWDAIIEEGRAMNATGTGITGGDPMMAAERSMEGPPMSICSTASSMVVPSLRIVRSKG